MPENHISNFYSKRFELQSSFQYLYAGAGREEEEIEIEFIQTNQRSV